MADSLPENPVSLPDGQPAQRQAESPGGDDVCERRIVVAVAEGLHARPAAMTVKLAKSFAADIAIVRGTATANAKSSVKIMLLGVKQGDEIIIRARGSDAAAAVERIAALLTTDFESALPVQAPPAPAVKPAADSLPAAPTTGFRGVAASEGCAIGEAFPYRLEPLEASPVEIPPAERMAEREKYQQAVETTVAALASSATGPESAIVDALIEVARDADLRAEVEAAIATGRNAAAAVINAGTALARRFEALDDPYLQARAEDIRGITRAIALTLLGRKDPSLRDVPDGAIIVADELNALELVKAPLGRIGGIVCRRGAATAHTAIVARAYDIPAVLGCASLPEIAPGTRLALDGASGEVFIAPDTATEQRMTAAIAARREARAALAVYRSVHPRTRDGVAIHVAANLGSLVEIEPALAAGAMGVGLFRTELLFMANNRPCTEDEQAAAYLRLAEAFKPWPVIVRTLDVGGDKPIPGLEVPPEDNPFLGWRGIRLCLDRPEIFKPQLRALLRAAVHGNLKIMLPMVSDVEEVRRTWALIEVCRAELSSAGVTHGLPELGVMIETPAAMLQADQLAAEVSFFSIGTNDLTQYVMAADRGNPRVAHLSRADHPAVLRAVAMICEAARARGIPVGVCGEAAAQPKLIPEFVRLGVTELSMGAASILRAKKIIGEIEAAGAA
jgi:phosphocarrier protein FPr